NLSSCNFFRRSMLRPSASFLVVTLLSVVTSTAKAAITKGPWVQRVTPTSAVVRFELDAPAPATVKLGPENAVVRDGGAQVFESPEARTLHSVTLTGLEPATRYAYAVNTASGRRLAAVTTAPAEDSNATF